MTDFDRIKATLEGKRLMGFMELKDNEMPGDADNAIALYLGHPESMECYVLHSVNQDWSMYDVWDITKQETPIAIDSRYKSIGENIESIENVGLAGETPKAWYSGEYYIQFQIKTATRTLRFGHQWNDCHYPNSIWDIL